MILRFVLVVISFHADLQLLDESILGVLLLEVRVTAALTGRRVHSLTTTRSGTLARSRRFRRGLATFVHTHIARVLISN